MSDSKLDSRSLWPLIYRFICGLALVSQTHAIPPQASPDTEDVGNVEAEEGSGEKAETADTDNKDVLGDSVDTDNVVWMNSLSSGKIAARLNNRRMFVVVGATWCTFCSELEAEIAGSIEAEIAQQFTLVKIDADRQIGDAKTLEANALPALRVVTMDGRQIAGHDGYLPGNDLLAWLNGIPANSAIDEILTKPGSDLASEDIEQLVSLLGDRDVEVRSIVTQRLIEKPQLASSVVVTAFETGNLAMRLESLRLLRHWKAPVDGIDPWNPESVNEERVEKLKRWTEESEWSVNGPTNSDQTPKEDENAAIRDRIKAFLEDPEMLVEAELSALSIDAKAVHVEGTALMRKLTRMGQTHPPKLRRLVYTLSASKETRLARRGPLHALAEGPTIARRTSASQIAKAAIEGDLPLLTSMLADEDPLVREYALQNLTRVAPDADPKRLTNLLKDPDKNVRAGVLKQLAILQTPQALDAVKAYLLSETDTDLVIYAIRYLKSTDSDQAIPILISRLEDNDWQVRAAAVEALGSVYAASANRGNSETETQSLVSDAVLSAANDEDSFVSAKAAAQLGSIISTRTVSSIFDLLRDRPSIARQVSETVRDDREASTIFYNEIRQRAKAEGESELASAIHLSLRFRKDRVLDETPDSVIPPSTLIRVAVQASDQSTQRDALRLLLQDAQQVLHKELLLTKPFNDPTEVFESLDEETGESGKRRLTDGMPFESSTGLVDLLFDMRIDKAVVDNIRLESVDQQPLRRVDEFFGIPAVESAVPPKLLPKPRTQREIMTALWSGRAARIKVRSMLAPIVPQLSELNDTRTDPIIRGLVSSIQAIAIASPERWDDSRMQDIGGWIEVDTSTADERLIDRDLQSRMLWMLPASNEIDGRTQRDPDAIRSLAGQHRKQLLFDRMWVNADAKHQAQLLLDAGQPPGIGSFRFLLKQLEKLDSSEWNQNAMQAHASALLIASGSQTPRIYQLLENYSHTYDLTYPCPKAFQKELAEYANRYNPAGAVSMMVLGNRNTKAASVVANQWLDDSDASGRFRYLAAAALALGSGEDGHKNRTMVINKLVGDSDPKIQTLGLQLAANQSTVNQTLWKLFGESVYFPDFKTVKREVDEETLRKFAKSDRPDDAALAVGLQAIADPSGDYDLTGLVRHVSEHPDEDSRLKLLFEVLLRRDQEADLGTLKRAVKWMEEHMDSWESDSIKRRIVKMKTESARTLVTVEEDEFVDGVFFDF
ncbi:MAG: HEAT repeat domain-containing protein [Planctomycetota bacterium]